MEPPIEETTHRPGNARHERELVGSQRAFAGEFGYVRRII
jgi:hypothetical protein